MKVNIEERIKSIQLLYKNSLILNPTENIPWISGIDTNFLQGMYLPENMRTNEDKVIFAGREAINTPGDNLYEMWQKLIGVQHVSMKYHSGLDAHIILFMSISKIGDKVLLLPELAGGHFSTYEILTRLGLVIKEFIVNKPKLCIDIEQSKKLINEWKPDYIFVDRSEGLNYEDFSWLKQYSKICKVFDASQYLSHIISNHYQNPFDMGFDIVVSTLHKNYPGTQKAAVFVKNNQYIWDKIEFGLKTYISNTHPKDIFDVLLATPPLSVISEYSETVLKNAEALEENLLAMKVPVVKRNKYVPITQHIWIETHNKEKAYKYFRNLENLKILTNYRLLPYGLGFGLRLGTAAATRQGLTPSGTLQLAKVLAKTWENDIIDNNLKKSAEEMIKNIKQ